MLQVAFFTQICGTLPSIFAVILMSTHGSFEMLGVCFSCKNTSLCLTCRGGQGRAELGLQCRPSFVHQTGTRADYRPRNCPFALLKGACWIIHAPAHEQAPHRSASARGLTHSLPQQSCPQNFPAGSDTAHSVSWPLCKSKGLFLCEEKYFSSFQSCKFNKVFEGWELFWKKNQQRQRVDAKIKVSLQKCFRF